MIISIHSLLRLSSYPLNMFPPPIPCLSFLIALNPISTAHMYMGVGSPNGVWETTSKKNDSLCSSRYQLPLAPH